MSTILARNMSLSGIPVTAFGARCRNVGTFRAPQPFQVDSHSSHMDSTNSLTRTSNTTMRRQTDGIPNAKSGVASDQTWVPLGACSPPEVRM